MWCLIIHLVLSPLTCSASVPPNWKTLVETRTELATDEYFDLAKMWDLTDAFENNEVDETTTATQDNTLVDSPVSDGDIAPNKTCLGEQGIPDIGMPSMINMDTVVLRRSPRILAQDESPKRMTFVTILCIVNNVVAKITSVIKNTPSYATRTRTCMEEVNRNFDGNPNLTHLFSFATSIVDNESYTLKEALKKEDAAGFIQTILKEDGSHKKNNHWILMKRSYIGRIKTIISI